MSIFKCKMCGGTIEFEQGASVGVCDSCGTKQTLPKLDDDCRANLYDRANHFRRGNEFDKAAGIYEQILNEDNTDSEAYWSLVLCRYGIEYVEDPSTHKRVPTVNRAQFTSIFDDENYRSALQHADGYQRSIYEEEAAAINEIQKGILAISQKEDPFDVFICYKETDSSGRRTQDSVLANDIYHQLTNEGFKVFFARITLEDKLGTEYEPYIFAALNSAKVMIVLGTKQEHFNAVWVKNEWSRYLTLVKQSGGKKMLIPAYRDMDPYDLPEEFSHLQAQDMSKLGFMQDLIRGIKKIIAADEPKAVVKETVVISGGTETASLLKRAFMYLEDRDWKSADEYCERVLDKEPENAEAYLGKLLAELNVIKEELLPSLKKDFSDSKNYQKCVRFGNNRLTELNKKAIYNNATDIMNSANSEERFKEAAGIFKGLLQFEDAPAKADECLAKAEEARKESIYRSGCNALRSDDIGELKRGVSLFNNILGYKDADELAEKCRLKIEKINAESERRRLEQQREAEQRRIDDEKRRKKNKKIAAITIPIVIICFAFVILLPTVIIPVINYNSAMELYYNNRYEEAISAFEKMDGYNDSENMILQCKYDISVDLCDNGKYEEAILSFAEIRDFSDSSDRIRSVYDSWANSEGIFGTQEYTEYLKGIAYYEKSNYENASDSFYKAGNILNSSIKLNECLEILYENCCWCIDNDIYGDVGTKLDFLVDHGFENAKSKQSYIMKLFDDVNGAYKVKSARYDFLKEIEITVTANYNDGKVSVDFSRGFSEWGHCYGTYAPDKILSGGNGYFNNAKFTGRNTLEFTYLNEELTAYKK